MLKAGPSRLSAGEPPKSSRDASSSRRANGSGGSPANSFALPWQEADGKVRSACCTLTGRKSPKPNQGCVARDVAAALRNETKLAGAGTWEMATFWISHGAVARPSCVAGPVSSKPNGRESSEPTGATVRDVTPSSRGPNWPSVSV